MIKVTVGNEVRDARNVDQQWLCNQINGRRRDHEPVCVRVDVKNGKDVDLFLQTPGCPAGLGCPRQLTPRESRIVDEWRERDLDRPDFSCGGVHAFLVQLPRLI